MQKLRREVEKAKRMLSYNNEALIEVENLVNFEDFVQEPDLRKLTWFVLKIL